VVGIEITFEILKPVGFLHHDVGFSDGGSRQGVHLEHRERRWLLPGTHVDLDHVANGTAGVGLGFNLGLKRCSLPRI